MSDNIKNETLEVVPCPVCGRRPTPHCSEGTWSMSCDKMMQGKTLEMSGGYHKIYTFPATTKEIAILSWNKLADKDHVSKPLS